MANNFLVSCVDPAMDGLTSSFQAMRLRDEAYEKKRFKAASEPRVYIRLVPCTPFLVNINTLFDRATLSQLSPQTVAVTLLTHRANDPNSVWLRVVPSQDWYEYNVYDPRAKDLERCGHLFCQVRVYRGEEAYIREVAAPSFSGKKMVQLTLNLIKACGVKRALIRDGSKAVGCCKEGTPCSLHAISVFKRGVSWYRAQGAKYNVATTGFHDYRAAEFLDSEYAFQLTAQNRKPRHSLDYYWTDYDTYRGHSITYYNQEETLSSEANRCASSYLYRLTVSELRDSITALVSCNASRKLTSSLMITSEMRLKRAINLIEQRRGALSESMTVGSFLEILEQEGRTDAAIHGLMHNCRDFICSNRASIFFQNIVDDLFASTPTVSSLAYASVILDYWTHKAKDLRLALYTVAQCQLFNTVKEYEKEYNEAAQKLKEKWKKEEALAIEEEAKNAGWSPARAKVVAAATKPSRDLSISYQNDMGCEDPFAALEAALRHLSQATFQQLGTLFPQLIENGDCLEEKLRDVTYGIPAKEQKGQQQAWARFIIRIVQESISSTIVRVFSEQEKRGSLNETIYRRFMLAKYALSKGVWAQFTL